MAKTKYEETLPFEKQDILKDDDGTLYQIIRYTRNGEKYLTAVLGEDVKDLERAWAFKYLELLDK